MPDNHPSNNPRPRPGAAFMEGATNRLTQAIDFILDRIETMRVVGGTSHTIDVKVRRPDQSPLFAVPLHIRVEKPDLVSEILEAADRDRICLRDLLVIVGTLHQPRLVLFLDDRVVAQLFCARDSQSVQLEIIERPDAQIIGGTTMVLGTLKVNVITPFGSALVDRD
jgi:hypothetical protein